MRNDQLTFSDVGSYMRKLRKESKLSRHDVARRAKVSPRTIYNIENGCHIPRIPELARISSVYDMTLMDLFTASSLYYDSLNN